MMKKYFILSSAFLILISGIVFAQDTAKVSKYLSGKRSGITNSGKQFSFEWSYIPFDGRKIIKWIGGDTSASPKYVIDYIKLSVDNVKYLIPKESYQDIYDPSVSGFGLYLMESQKEIYLIIQASDGAGSAEIWLYFESGKFTKRRIKKFDTEGNKNIRN